MGPRRLFALTTLALAVAASAAEARDIRVRSGRRGMQRALERAKPGDRIVLRRTVRGDVTVTVPGITIEGQAHNRFTGSVVVEADGVAIRGASFKRAELRVTGDDVVLAGNTFDTSAVDVAGDRASVQGNVIDTHHKVEAAVTVRGDGTMIAGNTVSTFTQAIRVAGADAVVHGNTFENGWTAVTVAGDDAVVSENEFKGVTLATFVGGDRAALTANVVNGGESLVVGDDATIERNEVASSSGGPAVTVSGDRVLIAHNTLSGPSGGARVHGDGSVLRDNVVRALAQGFGAGIVSVGKDALISGNHVRVERALLSGSISSAPRGAPDPNAVREELVSAGNDGIVSFGGGARVLENDVTGTFAGGAALRVQGDANTVDGNSVHDAVHAYALVMIGESNSASSNDVDGVEGEGVVVQGEQGVVVDTSVRGAIGCGFLLIGGTRLEGCAATACSMGVVNLSLGSSIVGTTVSGNAPYELVDLGHASIADDSVVGWTATGIENFPDFWSLRGQGFTPAKAPQIPSVVPNPAMWR